ncbi:MAG: hypothetical protein C0469_04010 [Cyanobacteria bacterium DS2.3.42]|nr:hypothetical protein [Cyanobacteria bacterium DS2.3.42]
MNVFAVLLSVFLLTNCPASASPNDAMRAFNLYKQSQKNYSNPKLHAVAVEQINEALRMFPQNSLFLFQKGLCLSVSEEEDDAALNCVEKALALTPTLGCAWCLKAGLLLRNKKPELAIQCADKAIKYDSPCHMVRLHCLQKMERFPEALKETEAQLRKTPSQALLLSLHADLSRQQKHWQAVVDDTTKLLKITNTKDASYLSHLKARAEAYIVTHQDDRALPDLEAVAKRSSLDRQVHIEMLKIYKRKKDLKNIEKEEAYIKKMDQDLSP